MSRLLRELSPVARRATRKVLNDPRVDVHVGRRLLGWVLSWKHQTDLNIRSYITRTAANEARRIRAMSERERDDYFRLWDARHLRVVRPAEFPGESDTSGVPPDGNLT